MKRFVEGTDRGQSTLFPAVLDDYVGADNPVRAIDVFVDGLDVAKLGFHGVAPLATGCPISQYLCIIGCFCGPVCWLLCRRTTLLREETREAVGFF